MMLEHIDARSEVEQSAVPSRKSENEIVTSDNHVKLSIRTMDLGVLLGFNMRSRLFRVVLAFQGSFAFSSVLEWAPQLFQLQWVQCFEWTGCSVLGHPSISQCTGRRRFEDSLAPSALGGMLSSHPVAPSVLRALFSRAQQLWLHRVRCFCAAQCLRYGT